MQTKIFLLSHQDDEIAILNHIKQSVESNDKIFIFYCTNGRIKKIEHSKIVDKREKESIKVLEKIGVKRESVIFLGNKLDTNSYELHNKLDVTFDELSDFFEKIKDEIILFTHSWEGGNVDHDSCFVLALKLIKKFTLISQAYQFAMYNSNKMPFNFYRAFSPIKENGPLLKFDIKLKDKMQFISILFYYKSQLKIWIGLYPFLIFKIVFNKYGYLQVIDRNFILKKPHENDLWYEKRNFITYNEIETLFSKFLK